VITDDGAGIGIDDFLKNVCMAPSRLGAFLKYGSIALISPLPPSLSMMGFVIPAGELVSIQK
jgi:hypothetical protein